MLIIIITHRDPDSTRHRLRASRLAALQRSMERIIDVKVRPFLWISQALNGAANESYQHTVDKYLDLMA
jgi:hypothetical protein